MRLIDPARNGEVAKHTRHAPLTSHVPRPHLQRAKSGLRLHFSRTRNVQRHYRQPDWTFLGNVAIDWVYACGNASLWHGTVMKRDTARRRTQAFYYLCAFSLLGFLLCYSSTNKPFCFVHRSLHKNRHLILDHAPR